MTTRLRTNFVSGTITDNPLLTAAVTFNSQQLAALPVVAAPDFAVITLDPARINGPAEVVYVTAHTAGATSATVLRGQEGTAARDHLQGERWGLGPTAGDFWGGGQTWYGDQRIDGRLGIGAAPTYSLDVLTTKTSGSDGARIIQLADLQSPQYVLARGMTSGGPPTINKTLGALNIMGALSAGTYGGGAAIAVLAAENFGAAAGGGTLVFYTTPVGTIALVEQMRIDDSGQVGIGRNPGVGLLDVAGEARFGGALGDRVIADDFQSYSRGKMMFRQAIVVNNSNVADPSPYTGGGLVVIGTAGGPTNDIVIQRPGALSSSNVSWTLSNRTNNTSLEIFGNDGTTFQPKILFDFTTATSIFGNWYFDDIASLGFNRNPSSGAIGHSANPAWQIIAGTTFQLQGYSGAGVAQGNPIDIATTGAWAYILGSGNVPATTTHESNRRDGYAQMYGRGFAFGADTIAHQGGVTAGLSISVGRTAPAVSFHNNNATGDVLQIWKAANLRMRLSDKLYLRSLAAVRRSEIVYEDSAGTAMWSFLTDSPVNNTRDIGLWDATNSRFGWTVDASDNMTVPNGYLQAQQLRSVAVGGTARLYIRATDAALDQKIWDLVPSGGNQLLGRVINDAENASDTWLTVTRSATTITNVQLKPPGIGFPTYVNSWVDYDGNTAWRGGRFFVDAQQFVHMEGLIKNATVTQTGVMFTLPVGYRPGKNHLFIVQCSGGNARVDVQSDGQVLLQSYLTGNGAYVSLSGINFSLQ